MSLFTSWLNLFLDILSDPSGRERKNRALMEELMQEAGDNFSVLYRALRKVQKASPTPKLSKTAIIAEIKRIRK